MLSSAHDTINKSTNAKRPEGFVVYRLGNNKTKIILVILSLSVDCCVEDLLLSTRHCDDLVALRYKRPFVIHTLS